MSEVRNDQKLPIGTGFFFLNQAVGSVVVVGIVGVVEVTKGEVTVVEGGRANLNSSRKKMLHSINFAIN